LDKALILHPHSVSNNLLNKALERSLAKIYHSVLHWDSFEQFLNTQGLLSFRSATTRYFKGGLGENVIIIINALGLTIQFWESIVKLLIGKYKVIIWETRCCEIATGGMEKVVSIEQHVEDISGIIQAEGHQKYHLLAWCNGGRIAAVAASAMPDSICSVIYLCPAFRGMQGLAPIDSKFEKDLDEVFSAALREHKMAGFLSSYILKTNKGEPEYDPHQVLGLPNQDCREAIVAPMRTGEYLLNYAKRTQNDETFPLRKLIPGISQPTLFVLGSNDAVVSNDFLKSVIGLFKQATTYEILGASHYIQMQQPEILMDIIESFLGNQNPGTISVRAELLNQKQQLNDRKN
jgi:pimeloyl-ACP methyl ester carboxylesterase